MRLNVSRMDMGRLIHFLLRIRYVVLIVFVALLGLTGFIYRTVPTAFVPQEDQGFFFIQVQAPQGASLGYTSNLADQANVILSQDHDIGPALFPSWASASPAMLPIRD